MPTITRASRALAAVLCLVLLFLGTGCGSRADVASESISAEELRAVLGTDDAPFLLDVRSVGEWDAGHIPGAVHIPVKQLESRLAEIPRDGGRPVVVYCALGPRASHAKKILEQNDLGPVLLLDGHMRNWAKSGFPVSRNGR